MDHLKSLRQLTRNPCLSLTTRGNAAIETVLKILPSPNSILIPEEGGWLTYHSLSAKLGLAFEGVQCHDALIDLADLETKLSRKKYVAFLYHSLGGYCAAEPIQEIYTLCQKYNCLVIMDVAGSIGTSLCDGRYADIIVGSFGKWKPINMGTGGFISCKEKSIFDKVISHLPPFPHPEKLPLLLQKINGLPQRLLFLQKRCQKIIKELTFPILHPQDQGLVAIVPFSTEQEKEIILAYCQKENLEWTVCPRYIRVNREAICIEVKRLTE